MPQHTLPALGIIANPASGRDIRRLTAKASVFPTVEKVNMIQRVLSAARAVGVTEVWVMPDVIGITSGLMRAIEINRNLHDAPWPRVRFIDMTVTDSAQDTLVAVRAMREAGVGAIVVLGGDGTHRNVAEACGEVPLATLSSGTNNAFPELREATVVGLAAGLASSGLLPRDCFRRNKLLRVRTPASTEIALVDVCITREAHVGSRALWRADQLAELYVAFGQPDAIGLSSIAGLLEPVSRDDAWGMWIRFGAGRHLMAPIAPGRVERLEVAEHGRLEPGRARRIAESCGTIALDGEREVEFSAGEEVSVSVELEGPLTIDVGRSLRHASKHGLWGA